MQHGHMEFVSGPTNKVLPLSVKLMKYYIMLGFLSGLIVVLGLMNP